MRFGRYDNPYKCVSFSAIDAEVRQDPVALEAADGGLSHGILYTRQRHRTALFFLHPKADMSRHYIIPQLLEAGYAAFGQNSRYLNNDEACVHESLLLDVAAGIRFLRQIGFEHIVLVGNSGGGSLFTFYQAQASTEPPHRLTHTPAGDALDLNSFDLPLADGYVHLAAHLGEGRILMQMIDPSVIDESDPLSCDASLDPFDPDNGYRQPPESSRYSADFVARYRAAQQARVACLDASARDQLEQRREARRAMTSPHFAVRPWHEQAVQMRQAVASAPMVIHRTEADLRAFDLSLDPSDRDAGSLFSYRPDLTNYMEFGFARVCTARAWLSTWSGLSSNADVMRNAAKVTIPALVLQYSGDNAIFPADARSAFDALGSRDKHLEMVPGDHYGFAVGTQERAGALRAVARLIDWLEPRFPI
ncbi:MAG TPA: hypothetical protein VEB21_19905 [Terriglobales bacterium]|nr:hypothetical protein [Terriglobales bacterium]